MRRGKFRLVANGIEARVARENATLPKGWTWTTLGKLGDWTGGGTPSKSNVDFWRGGAIPWVSPKDMKFDVVGETEDFITADAVSNSAAKYVPASSVLMVMRSGILRHTFPVAINDRTVTLNQDLRALTPREGVSAAFVARYLKSASRRILTECAKDGTTVNSIEVAALERLPVPIAPLPEQRRIVDRIDELFAEIAGGEAALAEARRGLDLFRRSLLKAAVTGELTRDWRETGRPAETGVELLARILDRRAARSVVPRRGRRSSTGTRERDSEIGNIPEGWAWATLGQLFDISTGSTPSRSEPKFWEGDVPWVSSGEVAFCRIQSTRETISREALRSADRVHPAGTVLLAMIGEGKTRGQCAILDVPATNNQNAAAIRVESTGIPSEYVYITLEQRYYDTRRESQGGNQPALNAGIVGEIPIPLPPPAEIEEILRRVSETQSAIEDTLKELNAADADAVRLRQSTLKAAFEGRLVPQEPDEEPASALLARLTAGASNGARGRGTANRGDRRG